jgi:3-phenylpropionate/cinnamic acid dioxygenase small subunit
VNAAVEITNLLYRYAEYMDSGDFAGAAALFDHAVLRVGAPDDATTDAAGMLTFWTTLVIQYDDGTPRTKHVVTNPILEIDEDAGTANCRSYYTVVQQVDGFGPQVIVCGRYYDQFERVVGRWRFCYRDYSMMDLIGDLSHHLRQRV